MIRPILVAALALTGAACSTVGVRSSTEEPAFSVVERLGEVEIRRYGARVAAETTVSGPQMRARNEGFRRLAGYIFGDNVSKASIAMTAPVAQATAKSQKIAMTAPVAEAQGDGGWTIQFFMPAKYALEDLPAPRDDSVRLRTVPGETYAVMRFSGARDGEAVTDHETALLQGLSQSAWRAAGEPVAWFYDPPWTLPMMRRNEVAVRVTPAG